MIRLLGRKYSLATGIQRPRLAMSYFMCFLLRTSNITISIYSFTFHGHNQRIPFFEEIASRSRETGLHFLMKGFNWFFWNDYNVSPYVYVQHNSIQRGHISEDCIYIFMQQTTQHLNIAKDRRSHDRMVVGFTTTYAIATKVVASNPAHGAVYSMQRYVYCFCLTFCLIFLKE